MPKSITIISTLPMLKTAPEKIKKDSIGVTISLPQRPELLRNPPQANKVAFTPEHYAVLRLVAINAFRQQERYEVANFLEALIHGEYFYFPQECCQPKN